MSAEFLDNQLSSSEQELAAALVSGQRLSTQDLEQISAAMQQLNLSFREAALHLGLVTPEDIEWGLSRGRTATSKWRYASTPPAARWCLMTDLPSDPVNGSS
jgi:hypothetical protein